METGIWRKSQERGDLMYCLPWWSYVLPVFFIVQTSLLFGLLTTEWMGKGENRLYPFLIKVPRLQWNPTLWPTCYYGYFILAQTKAQIDIYFLIYRTPLIQPVFCGPLTARLTGFHYIKITIVKCREIGMGTHSGSSTGIKDSWLKSL